MFEYFMVLGDFMVFWIIGLSGAGKSHIGQALSETLKEKHNNVLFLDGDIIRGIVGDNLGYDLEARRESGWRICRLCQYLDSQGVLVVCSVISLFEEHRIWNREHYSNYYETFVRVPLKELISRDPKKLYSKNLQGACPNVAGMDLPFTEPTSSDLIIDNVEPFQDASMWASMIIEKAGFFQSNLSQKRSQL